MIIAVSPYHITTREAPALAAMLLASRVVTLLPAPTDASAVTASGFAAHIPAYAEFTRSWGWSTPLWERGVISARLDDGCPEDDLSHVTAAIRVDDRYATLRAFLREEHFATEHTYLAAVSRDILKAGPDPGLSVPVVAALDRFATRLAAYAARPPATSVAQAAEARLGRTAFSIAVPVFVQATAERLLHAREVLCDVLTHLRDALDAQPAAVREGGSPDATSLETIARAAAEYTRAFEARRAELLADSTEDEVRVVDSLATISGVVMPADAVLRSSVAAMAALCRTRARTARPPAQERLPARHDPAEGRALLALVVKPMGARP